VGSVGERSEPERNEGSPGAPPLDPEVPEKPVRRNFTAEYKLRVLQEADTCREPGEIGALLRREGLYSSHLSAWRQQRAEGALQGLSGKRRGRKAAPKNPLARRVAELQRENAELRRRLGQAEAIIEVQKKVSDLLGLPRGEPESDGKS
jgi:transposase-like protein